MANGKWVRVNIEYFASIRGIHRPGRDGKIGGRVHVVPPEKFRAGEGGLGGTQFFPKLPALNEVVRLFPELDFSQFAVIPTVAHNAVLGGWEARDVSGLRTAG